MKKLICTRFICIDFCSYITHIINGLFLCLIQLQVTLFKIILFFSAGKIFSVTSRSRNARNYTAGDRGSQTVDRGKFLNLSY